MIKCKLNLLIFSFKNGKMKLVRVWPLTFLQCDAEAYVIFCHLFNSTGNKYFALQDKEDKQQQQQKDAFIRQLDILFKNRKTAWYHYSSDTYMKTKQDSL